MWTRLLSRGAAAGLVCCTLHSAGASPPAIPQYTVQNLGSFLPVGINASGDVYGADSYKTQGCFWSPEGGAINIGHLPDLAPSFQSPLNVLAMNDADQIVGSDEVMGPDFSSGLSQGVVHAFLWSPAPDRTSGSMVDLGVLTPGAPESSRATGINNAGQVIGYTFSAAGDFNIHGFLWSPNGVDGAPGNVRMKDLGDFRPVAIDDAGNVYGILNNALLIYSGGKFIDLGRPAPYLPGNSFMEMDTRSFLGDIDGNIGAPSIGNFYVWTPTPGAAAGIGRFATAPSGGVTAVGDLMASEIPIGDHLILSRDNGSPEPLIYALDPVAETLSRVDLGGFVYKPISTTLPISGAFNSNPTAFNALGDIVGRCGVLSSPDARAFVEHAGLMYDLNAITPPSSAVLTNSIGVNNAGKIVAAASYPGAASPEAVLLTPAAPAPVRPLQIFTALPQPPTEGDPDQYIGVSGTGFEVGAVVTFDDFSIEAKVYAESEIVAFLPRGSLTAGPHPIRVTDPDGRTAVVSYTVTAVHPYPTLATVTPSTIPVHTTDTRVSFTGTGLYNDSQISVIYYSGRSVPVTILGASPDHTTVTAMVPASLTTTGGVIAFTVDNPGERGAKTSYTSPTLTVRNPEPKITSISPSSFIADTLGVYNVTVTGAGFLPPSASTNLGTQVTIPGLSSYTYYDSPTQVRAIVYGGYNQPQIGDLRPGNYLLQVTNPAPGGGTFKATVNVTNGPNPAPHLTSISPTTLYAGTDGVLTLNGGIFQQHHSVIHIGSLTFPNTTSDGGDNSPITLVVPAAALTPGDYDVYVTNLGPGGGTSEVQKLTVVGASPIVQYVSLSRDPQTHYVVAQIVIANDGGKSGAAFINQATLGGMKCAGLPLRLGYLPHGTTVITANFPAASATEGVPADLSLSGTYPGGTITFDQNMTLGN